MKEPHVVHPCAVYTVESLRAVLGLTKSTIGREVRLGRLRVTKRAGKYFLIGSWILAWLRSGEVRRSTNNESREKVNT
jgi:hypothetical protein